MKGLIMSVHWKTQTNSPEVADHKDYFKWLESDRCKQLKSIGNDQSKSTPSTFNLVTD
jgi:hypothetical protein